jgi:hypothetical protein
METDAEIKEAIGAHGLWKGRLKKAIEGGTAELQPSVVQQDNQCAFGKWLYGSSLTSLEKNSPHYAECRELHRSFHVAAAKVLNLALTGRTQEANQAMGPGSEFGRLSLALTRAMTQWHDAVAGQKTAR